MGIKRDGKKLLKLGQKAAKRLGTEGKKQVAEFFAKAIAVLERELEKQRGETPSKKRAAKTTSRPRQPEAVRRVTLAKPRRRAIRPSKKAPARAAQRPQPATAHPVRTPGPAKPRPHVPTPAVQAPTPNGTE
jgi:hypothetical protein